MLKAGLSSVATTGNYLDLINKSVLSNNSSGAVTSVNTLIGDIVIDKSSIGLGNVDNTSDANKPISFLTNNALINKINTSLINAPNGVAGLDANTKIPSALLPPISFTAISVVANAAEMQALGATSVKGTVCVRTDVSKSYILNTDFFRVGSWGFNNMAQRTGVKVNATIAEITMDPAMVIENWR